MSEAQINKLFVMITELTDQVGAMKRIIERMAKNSDTILGETVLNIVHQHGMMLSNLTQVIEKLAIRCPELRPETNEFPKVELETIGD